MAEIPAVPRHDPGNNRYVAEVGGEVVAFSEYHLRGGNIYFFYIFGDNVEEGAGVASALVRFELEDVEARGGSVVPLCPFVAKWIERNPDYNRVVNQRIMERIGAQEEND